MKSKKIVLLSGGLDSTVVLAQVVDKFGADRVIALNMYYKQHNDLEIECAKKVADYYNVELIQLDLSTVFGNLKSAMLVLNPDAEDDFYVPARNSIFLSIASGIADSIEGVDEIYYGAHADDAGGYPDTTIEYLRKMTAAMEEGTRQRVKIKAPFVYGDKSNIVKAGVALNAPMHLTHSCYMNQNPPCGECDTCKLRAEAFKKAGIVDPLVKGEC